MPQTTQFQHVKKPAEKCVGGFGVFLRRIFCVAVFCASSSPKDAHCMSLEFSPARHKKHPKRIRPVRECAEVLGVSYRTLQRWIELGIGPAVIHLGPRRRGIDDDDLERFIAERRKAPPGEKAETREAAPA
ncbi:helix-turn-helix transcriptional regulator [Methylocystis suflitae]|uniref:helix-turn-helix transcriptional regulator n=1 Tax=Methylocystis suflitae TaxID=2951405 RepID=UPI002109C807|nr:helix-turn-helix domain-containing protein [Methylocystis suflitae]MCQ4188849.1 helix-turn-helix domain-containing protein [Methylocystis suflitae]